MFSCTLNLALGRLPTAPARSGHERDELAGGATPGPAHARGVLRRLDRLALIYRGLSSDRAGRLRSNFESFFKINFPFLENVRFVIFHPKLAQPPSPRFGMRYV